MTTPSFLGASVTTGTLVLDGQMIPMVPRCQFLPGEMASQETGAVISNQSAVIRRQKTEDRKGRKTGHGQGHAHGHETGGRFLATCGRCAPSYLVPVCVPLPVPDFGFLSSVFLISDSCLLNY